MFKSKLFSPNEPSLPLIALKGDGECILQVVWYVFYIQMTLCAGAHGIKYSAYHHGAHVN